MTKYEEAVTQIREYQYLKSIINTVAYSQASEVKAPSGRTAIEIELLNKYDATPLYVATLIKALNNNKNLLARIVEEQIVHEIYRLQREAQEELALVGIGGDPFKD